MTDLGPVIISCQGCGQRLIILQDRASCACGMRYQVHLDVTRLDMRTCPICGTVFPLRGVKARCSKRCTDLWWCAKRKQARAGNVSHETSEPAWSAVPAPEEVA